MKQKRKISVKTKKIKELLAKEKNDVKKDFFELLRRAVNTNLKS